MNRNEFFQALPVAKLNLKLTSASLEICTDDIEDIHVMASGGQSDMDELRIALTADVLTIEQPVSKLPRKATGTASWLQVTIRLPHSWKGAIEARTISGWMNIRSLAGTDLNVDTVSGMVMVSDVSFLTLSVRSVTGDIKLNQADCGKCSIFSTSGSLTVMRTALSRGSASTVTGEMCVDAPITECDAVLRSVSGRIRTSGVSIVEGADKLRATTVSSDLDLTCNIE